MYDVKWDGPFFHVRIAVDESSLPARMVQGNYLNCARMNVDVTSTGFLATCFCGSSASCSLRSDQWSFSVVRAHQPDWGVAADIDDLINLVLTTSWRRSGWIPVHSGAVTKGETCAVLCAPSGAGKTTLTAALIRRGWRTLGDDKLLLRLDPSGGSELVALVHSFNLDPNVRKWFPEVASIGVLPSYSVFSQKRRVNIGDFWPGRTIRSSRPTHLLQIALREDIDTVNMTPIKNNDILSILLHQTVIPKDVPSANQIVSTLAATAMHLKGYRVEIGKNAYDDIGFLSRLESALN
jgi:hypothetical protein